MSLKKVIYIHCYLILLLIIPASYVFNKRVRNGDIISYTVDVKDANLRFYYKNPNGEVFKSIQKLKEYLENNDQKLVFAMNGGMYQKDNSPQGLFIEDGKLIEKLNTGSGSGNFHLKPNGVFYLIKKNEGKICTTEDFRSDKSITYATQSGPMLIIDGNIHPAFKEGSANLNIRNGVGILPDGKILFAMSKSEINFYDFASYFKDMGCLNALYLDGYVSRTYLPEKDWVQTDGNFGVIIGATQPIKN